MNKEARLGNLSRLVALVHLVVNPSLHVLTSFSIFLVLVNLIDKTEHHDMTIL